MVVISLETIALCRLERVTVPLMELDLRHLQIMSVTFLELFLQCIFKLVIDELVLGIFLLLSKYCSLKIQMNITRFVLFLSFENLS